MSWKMRPWESRQSSLGGSLGAHPHSVASELGMWPGPPECPLTSVSSPTRCRFSRPAVRSWRQGKPRV